MTRYLMKIILCIKVSSDDYQLFNLEIHRVLGDFLHRSRKINILILLVMTPSQSKREI